ncbi:MAG: hypothetical protein ACO3NU_07860 [Arenicellales bacterium]
MSRLLLTFCAMLAAHGLAAAELIVGERLPEVTLQGDAGGRLDDSLWSSAALVGRVHLLMYVDPDESGLNAHVEQALAAKKYDQASVGSVGVINMAATWKPGFAIDMILKKKQEKFPIRFMYETSKRSSLSGGGLPTIPIMCLHSVGTNSCCSRTVALYRTNKLNNCCSGSTLKSRAKRTGNPNAHGH